MSLIDEFEPVSSFSDDRGMDLKIRLGKIKGKPAIQLYENNEFSKLGISTHLALRLQKVQSLCQAANVVIEIGIDNTIDNPRFYITGNLNGFLNQNYSDTLAPIFSPSTPISLLGKMEKCLG
ncbi:MAG: hypothetical protein DHS20C02_09720 [Micavibrio sp.]|nr:MAG: hypothetical protein DHS20C02_09720 [Micavibrio sp.]